MTFSIFTSCYNNIPLFRKEKKNKHLTMQKKIMKTKQQGAVLQLGAAASALVLLLTILNLEKAECLRTTAGALPCNATGKCFTDEFMMESETSRRILQAAGKGRTITYPVLDPKKTHCDRDVYGSCIGDGSKFYNDRPCNYQNTCNRPGQ